MSFEGFPKDAGVDSQESCGSLDIRGRWAHRPVNAAESPYLIIAGNNPRPAIYPLKEHFIGTPPLFKHSEVIDLLVGRAGIEPATT